MTVLSCAFEVRTNSADVAAGIRGIVARVEQDVPITRREVVTVTWTGEAFRIAGAGLADFELGLVSLLDALFDRLHRVALATLPDHIPIGAVCGSHRAGNFLIVGPKQGGKTTLGLALLLDGFAMSGDALALLRGGTAVAFPRRFQLRQDGLASIPELARSERFRDAAANPQAQKMVFIEPPDVGPAWRIAAAPVSALFYIEPNFGARSRIRPCAKVEMIRRVIPHCAPPASGRRDWLADLCATVDGAATHVVSLGDLASARTAMAEALGG